jgi:hypothetical protein
MTMLAPPLKTLLGTNMDWIHNFTKTRSSSILFLLFYTPIPNMGEKIKKERTFKGNKSSLD